MAKKDFSVKANPVLKYISTAVPEEEAVAPVVEEASAPVSNPGKERKSKRLNLLMLPSVLEDLTKVAAMRRTSVNDLMNTIAKAYVEENRKLVEQYDEVFEG